MSSGADEKPGIDARVRAAVAGDRGAVQAILLELLPRIRNLIRYLIRGDQDVDDIAQEALIALVRGLPGYRGDGKLASWADRVVVRVTFAWIRGTRRRRAVQIEKPDLAVVPDPGSGPDTYLSRREMVALLDHIPEEQRQVLVLHHVLEMTVPEIAQELGIPFETVRSRLRLGKASLRAQHEQRAQRSTKGGTA